jgi:hypothetical protein
LHRPVDGILEPVEVAPSFATVPVNDCRDFDEGSFDVVCYVEKHLSKRWFLAFLA